MPRMLADRVVARPKYAGDTDSGSTTMAEPKDPKLCRVLPRYVEETRAQTASVTAGVRATASINVQATAMQLSWQFARGMKGPTACRFQNTTSLRS